jgi:hypothetical protein
MTPSDITPLRDRVAGLTGPDREVDIDLWLMFDPDAPEAHAKGKIPLPWLWCVTSDIGAALAFVERVLPGWARGFDDGPKTCIAFVDPHDFSDRFTGARHTAEGPTPAIALLLAALSAPATLNTTEQS